MKAYQQYPHSKAPCWPIPWCMHIYLGAGKEKVMEDSVLED